MPLRVGHERGMNLVIFDARPEQTARTQRLTQADRAVIEESADRATPWAAGDAGNGRGQGNRQAQVVKWHDPRPATFSSAKPPPPPSRRPSSPSWSPLPRLHCLGNIDLAYRARKGETCMRRAKSETAGRTTPFDSRHPSRFLNCKVFRLGRRKKAEAERPKSLANRSVTRHPLA